MREWAATELATSTCRRDLDLHFGGIQDWAQREAMGRRMDVSLLRWLGLDRPPQHRVRHKAYRKLRQLRLGGDMARQRTGLGMLDGTDVVKGVQSSGARHEAHSCKFP